MSLSKDMFKRLYFSIQSHQELSETVKSEIDQLVDKIILSFERKYTDIL